MTNDNNSKSVGSSVPFHPHNGHRLNFVPVILCRYFFRSPQLSTSAIRDPVRLALLLALTATLLDCVVDLFTRKAETSVFLHAMVTLCPRSMAQVAT